MQRGAVMSKMTKGPWDVYPGRSKGFCIGQMHVMSGNGKMVIGSEDEYGHIGPIKSEADANLIAAAPDLLSALTSVAEMNPVLPTGMIEAVHAAIKKAMGGAEDL